MKYQDRVSPHLSPPPLIPFHFLVSFTFPPSHSLPCFISTYLLSVRHSRRTSLGSRLAEKVHKVSVSMKLRFYWGKR